MRQLFRLLLLFAIVGCSPSLNRVNTAAAVTGVSVGQNILTITGTNLRKVSEVTIQDGGTSLPFAISSKSDTGITATPLQQASLLIGKLYTLLLSSSKADTIPITFELPNPLTVSGTFVFNNGTEGSGKLLASSSDGTANWQKFPKFRARMSATQSVSNATNTIIAFDTEIFDTNGNYDNSSGNYKFLPTVAGYYAIIVTARLSATGISARNLLINKNGVNVAAHQLINGDATSDLELTHTVYLNGTTDYVQALANVTGSSGQEVDSNVGITSFTGFLLP